MLDYYYMVNKQFLENFNRMNFKTDDIRIAIILTSNKIVTEQPLNNLKIDSTKTLWTLSADTSVFKDVKIEGHFFVQIYNKTIDNTVIRTTALQQPPIDPINDITIHWNSSSGIIQLKKS